MHVLDTIVEGSMVTPRSRLTTLRILVLPHLLPDIEYHDIVQAAIRYASEEHQHVVRSRHVCQRCAFPGCWVRKPLSGSLLSPFELFHCLTQNYKGGLPSES
jgi:hypothetical protein